jgi:methionine synthase II (cobalamin-independent)
VKPEHFIACTNCGLSPTPRPVALAKLRALVAGTKLACEAL